MRFGRAPAAASAQPERVTEALSRAGAWDAQPKVWIIRAAPLQEGVLAFQRRTDLGVDPASHAGLAVVGEPDHGVIALVLADRRAELRPFPRKLEGARNARAVRGSSGHPWANRKSSSPCRRDGWRRRRG